MIMTNTENEKSEYFKWLETDKINNGHLYIVQDDEFEPDLRDVFNDGVGQSRANRELKYYTLNEMFSEYPEKPEPLIDGLLRRSEVMNLIGSSKAGKSLFASQIGLSVASGRNLLGRFQCAKGRVLLVDNELMPGVWSDRLKKTVEKMGLKNEKLDIQLLSLYGSLMDIDKLSKVLCENEHKYDLIILDCLYKFMPDNRQENSNSDMGYLCIKIEEIAQKTGAAVIVVHHATKGKQSDKLTTDIGAGGGALARSTGTHAVLVQPNKENENEYEFRAVCRSWQQPENIRLIRDYPIWTVAGEVSNNSKYEGLLADSINREIGKFMYAIWKDDIDVKYRKNALYMKAEVNTYGMKKTDKLLTRAIEREFIVANILKEKGNPKEFSVSNKGRLLMSQIIGINHEKYG